MAAVRRGAAALVARLRAALPSRFAFPYRVELKAGKKYAWCSCGHSRAQVRGCGMGPAWVGGGSRSFLLAAPRPFFASQPFCDGAHRTLAPDRAPLRFTAEADGKVWLCGCKRTRTPPRCDGSHLRLWVAGRGDRR